MTSGHTRPSWWDSTIARDALRDGAVAHVHQHGGTTVRLSPEPLLRRAASGGLTQSVRVDVDPAPRTPLTHAVLRSADGAPVDCEVIDGPAGAVRVLVPEVDAEVSATLDLPGLGLSEPLPLTLRPQRHWTVHLVQHAHLDIGYTDPQGTVLAEGRAALDTCLELIRATDDWPEPARYRWSVEGLSTFTDWAAHRPPGQVAEFVRRIHEGRIELTALPFNLHSETCSVDELHELLRDAVDLRERHGVSLTTAMQTDVPGQVVGLQDALVEHGVRGLSVAHNWAGRAVPHLVGGARLPRLFRWRASDERSLLVWRTDTPHGLAYMEGSIIGFDESAAAVDDLFPAYLTALAAHPVPHQGKGVPGYPILDAPYEADPYPWDLLHLRVLGTFADNGPPRLVAAETVRRWNETWAYPHLRLSRHEDFFADAEARLGDRLETFEGDWSDWWVDGVGSGAAPMAMNRAAQSALTDAQTLDALAGLRGAEGGPAPAADTADVYRAASLFNEHTWGAGDPWTYGCRGHQSGERQWHWKYGQAVRAHDGALALLERAGHRLGSALPVGAGVRASFHVVNTRGRTRTDMVRFFLPESVLPLDRPVRVTDGRDGRDLPVVCEPQSNPLHRAAGRHLHVTVADVPPLGTVRLDVTEAEPASVEDDVADSAVPDSAVLENDFLAVRVDLRRSRIASVVDKATGAELVADDAVFGFNGYVYDQYATAGGFNHQSSKTVADDSMHLLAGREVAPASVLVERTSSAVAETLVYECVPPGAARLRTTVTLPHGVARLDIANHLAKPATMTKESAFFAFPFALDAPVVRMEASGGAVGTGLPLIPGSALHMRAIRRWVTLAEGDTAVGWATHDAPLLQHGNIAVPYVPYPPSVPGQEPGTLYSWVHNNIWDTNFPSQQSFEQTFRYSVAVRRYGDPASASALGMRASDPGHPLLAVRATGAVGGDTAETSLVSVDHPDVRVVGLLPQEPDAFLIRLQSFADEPVTADVALTAPYTAALRCSYLGENGEPVAPRPDGTLRVRIAAGGTAALLVITEP
ncbi:glycoside hydrolase family 38 C-terminal domain-containing protein [Streptomyces sp. CBMA29]|uniref:glycoside hydrolase family 38 N-terminal domain-containing protein n=1 Tax=Streptomyces sp. CBMA29 TaxID=1896314 RepID=UPI001661A4B5|nr:glycoside hydrolase family 38 C-terminal domain-containing protein [Streptomyces sp. CBMA29]MBD0734765.1 alpha-mannosidase [Streptomyces sp. CBMA29]